MLVRVPFCKPDYGIEERRALETSIQSGKLEGGGAMTVQCEALLTSMIGCSRTLITPSCTAALEMMALVLDLQPGDEIIMPSFTFVSTANAFALRGCVPVFVDMDPKTFTIDPEQVESAITTRTRAVVAVHYGGVGCDMDALTRICSDNNIVLLEDAAQACGASWNGQPLGSFGDLGAFSFHHTKNVTCGEGGALTINNPNLVRRCEIIRDKGTDRSDFLKGIVKKYEWQDLGSSYLLSELAAAVLSVQLKREQSLTRNRLALWEKYDAALSGLPMVKTPYIPKQAKHNAHIYSLCFETMGLRDHCIASLRKKGIVAAPHYVSLHLTPAGKMMGRTHGALSNTVRVTQTQMRLPLFSSMEAFQQDIVINAVLDFLNMIS